MAISTRVRTTKTNLNSEVNRVDPENLMKDQFHVEYRFSNKREFIGNPGKRGAYTPEPE